MTKIEKIFYERLAIQEEYGGTDKPINRIQPLVSVVTITYQHAPYICQCLDSILMQETDFPYEIIIGEDGSTDGTREICIEYANKYPEKIRLFLRDRKLSHYTDSRGRSIRLNGHFSREEARGKYIALCEGDDYWISTKKLQIQVSFLESNKNYTLSSHNAYCLHDSDNSKTVFSNILFETDLNTKQLIDNWLIPTCSMVYKRECIDKPRWELNVTNGDIVLQILLSKKGKVHYFPALFGVYRVHSGGLTQIAKNNLKSFVLNQIYLFTNLLINLSPKYWFVCIYQIFRYSFSFVKLNLKIK